MEKIKGQVNIIRKKRMRSSETTPLQPNRKQLLYFFRLLRRLKNLVFSALSLLVVQILLEFFLIFLSYRYLKINQERGVIGSDYYFFILAALSAVYLVVTFLAIKQERVLMIKIVNVLRQSWFSRFLKKIGPGMIEEKSLLLAKFSYHLPLLSMGLKNFLAGSVRWLLLVFVLLMLSFLYGLHALPLVLAVLAINIALGFLAYYIARKYVSGEVSFYSKIIRLADNSLSDWQFTKFFHRERATENDFNHLVNLDSYFRVRRDLWMRYGVSLIFVSILIVGSFFNFFSDIANNFFLENTLDQQFIFAVFFLYFSRLLYESLRVGLYCPPFLIGTALSVPLKGGKRIEKLRKYQGSSINFYSSKIKLFRHSSSYQKMDFSLQKGGRYIIKGGRRSGKSALAKLMVGQGEYGRRAWVIKSEGKRFFYNEFFGIFSGFYLISPNFYSEKNILEVIAGKERSRISDVDFSRIVDQAEKSGLIKNLLFEKEDWRQMAGKLAGNSLGSLSLQVAHCLENRPSLVAIDNHWLDLNDKEIDRLLVILNQFLPESILVFFSTADRSNFLNFTSHYEI